MFVLSRARTCESGRRRRHSGPPGLVQRNLEPLLQNRKQFAGPRRRVHDSPEWSCSLKARVTPVLARRRLGAEQTLVGIASLLERYAVSALVDPLPAKWGTRGACVGGDSGRWQSAPRTRERQCPIHADSWITGFQVSGLAARTPASI
jgi:hypothetical protein